MSSNTGQTCRIRKSVSVRSDTRKERRKQQAEGRLQTLPRPASSTLILKHVNEAVCFVNADNGCVYESVFSRSRSFHFSISDLKQITTNQIGSSQGLTYQVKSDSMNCDFKILDILDREHHHIMSYLPITHSESIQRLFPAVCASTQCGCGTMVVLDLSLHPISNLFTSLHTFIKKGNLEVADDEHNLLDTFRKAKNGCETTKELYGELRRHIRFGSDIIECHKASKAAITDALVHLLIFGKACAGACGMKYGLFNRLDLSGEMEIIET